MDSFQNTKLIFENWKKFVNEEDTWARKERELAQEGEKSPIEVAVYNVITGGKKASEGDKQTILDIFQDYNEDKVTYKHLKALIKIIVLDIHKGGEISAAFADASGSDAFALALGATAKFAGMATGASTIYAGLKKTLIVTKNAFDAHKKDLASGNVTADLLATLTNIPDGQTPKDPNLMKSLDVHDAFTSTISEQTFLRFLEYYSGVINSNDEEQLVPKDLADEAMKMFLHQEQNLIANPVG